jgi:hypothetical protein
MLVPILVIGGLVLLYVGTYALNKKVPIPEECKDLTDEATCTACHNFTCSYKK